MNKPETSNSAEARVPLEPRVSALRLWRFMGAPGAWIFIMAVLLILELFTGPSSENSFWIATLLFAYFASRIAAALEKMADRE